MSDAIVRKIAVIFVADVVGFSKMMETNEDETLRSFRACQDIMENLFAEHGGRIFNTAGDAVLAEFQSAVSSVVCASEFQKLVEQRNSSVDDDAKMMFRVGINMGDVIVEGDNLYGDGVNVAARLEALSQPGGVCLSKSVHDFVSQKVDLSFDDIGEQRVKNTDVWAYDIQMTTAERRTLSASQPAPGNAESKPPTIAVLPFINQSNDPDQDYFADGLSEDIISNLSSWKTFPVIARNSSFSYRDSASTATQIAVELGAEYLVTGSVRKGGNKVRVTASLTSGADNEQVWSQKWDRPLDDIFEVQDEVSQAIVALLAPAVTGQEQKRLLTQKKTSSLSAWDLYLQALSMFNSDDENYEDVVEKCKGAIELDNDFCDAYVLVCRSLFGKVFSSEYADKRAENEALYHQMANKAFDIDPNNPEAVIALSRSYNIKRDYDKRVELAERALELNPNHPACNHDYGLAITNLGRFEDALDHVFKAMKMDPARQRQYDFILPLIYMAMDDSENALKYTKEHNNFRPHSRYEGYLAAIYAHSGDLDMAKTHLATFLEQRPEVKTLADYEKVVPTICKDFVMGGLAKAGLPEA